MEDVQIFETQPDIEEESIVSQSEPENDSEIESYTPSMDEVAHDFVQHAVFSRESVPMKVSRIKRDIQDLQKMGAYEQAQSLLDELKSAVNHKVLVNETKPSTTENSEPVEHYVRALQLQPLEERISRLEETVGSSMRSPQIKTPIAVQLLSLSKILALLGTDEDSLKKKIEMIKELPEELDTDGKINWLYSHLNALDMAICAMPSVASRLQTLNSLHSGWVNADQRLKALESQMDTIKIEISEWKKTLEITESSVGRYIEVSNRNREILTKK